jgi:hypothetical protein
VQFFFDRSKSSAIATGEMSQCALSRPKIRCCPALVPDPETRCLARRQHGYLAPWCASTPLWRYRLGAPVGFPARGRAGADSQAGAGSSTWQPQHITRGQRFKWAWAWACVQRARVRISTAQRDIGLLIAARWHGSFAKISRTWWRHPDHGDAYRAPFALLPSFVPPKWCALWPGR